MPLQSISRNYVKYPKRNIKKFFGLFKVLYSQKVIICKINTTICFIFSALCGMTNFVRSEFFMAEMVMMLSVAKLPKKFNTKYLQNSLEIVLVCFPEFFILMPIFFWGKKSFLIFAGCVLGFYLTVILSELWLDEFSRI